jgi:peptide/nickel transport system substrate-binding protein
MKKFLLVVLLLFVAIFAMAACRGDGDAAEEVSVEVTPTPTPAPPTTPPPEVPIGGRELILAGIPDIEPSGYVVFGSGTMGDANIMWPAWTNPAPNSQARVLMFEGLDTMSRNPLNEFFPNPIVMVDGAFPQIIDNADGSRTYRFTIYTDNPFSDGRLITAYDYAGFIAFLTSPQWGLLIPNVTHAPEIAGRYDWVNGHADTLTGVRVYNESEFSVTIRAEYLPFIWEIESYMNWGPYPLHALGVEAHDDGNGVFLTGIGRVPLTNEALAAAVNGGTYTFVEIRVNEETGEEYEFDTGMIMGDGFRFRPTVFVGPYMFYDFDPSTRQITLVANPLFPGTWDGHRPRIQHVIFRRVPTPLIVDALVSGEIDMVVGQGGGATINEMLERAVGGGTHSFESYNRHGFGFINFHVDHGPTQFTSVRQAIKWLIDRDTFAEMFTLGHGVVNHGPYGLGWWYAQEAINRGMYERLIMYTYNRTRAIEILEADGWVYDAQGNAFVGPGNWATGNIRHRWVDGELMPLEIQWATFAPEDGNRITEIIDVLLPGPLEYAGISLIAYRTSDALSHLQRAINPEPEFHMFNLGMTLNPLFTPWFTYCITQIPNPNWMYVDDARALYYATRIRFMEVVTEAGRDEFIEAFIDLMEVLNYEVFQIPLYVDIWFDFIPNRLRNWHNSSLWGFPHAIQRAYIVD